MKKPILICLCNALMLFVLSFPVDARMLIGLSPVRALSQIDQTELQKLSESFNKIAGIEVTFRRFDNDAALTNWLMRFQEIDAAIVAPTFINDQPAGALQHLLDLHTDKRRSPPMSLVVRSNLSDAQAAQAKDAFLEVFKSEKGQKLLQEIGFAGVTLPGAPLKQTTEKPAPAQKRPIEVKSSPAPVPAQPSKAVQPGKEAQPAKVGEIQAERVASTKRPAEKPPAAVIKEKTQIKEESIASPERQPAVATKPDQAPLVVTAKPKVTEQTPVKTKTPAGSPTTPAKANEKDAAKPQESKAKESSDTNKQKPEPNKRVLVFVSLLLILAVLAKICLFALRWRKTKESTFRSEDAPNNDAVLKRTESSTPVEPAKSAPADEQVVIEMGRLGPGTVPALLKKCAELPEPVVLSVTKGACEKLIHFAGGQVASALTQNSTATESGVRWDKLGSLLVREELITSEGRDEALTLISKNPRLRLGEALLKLDLIDLPGLRHALSRQTKVTIYSLILFPEGRYQVIADDGSLPPEESVSLEVTNLIREASHHKSEWTAIRQALPSLNTVLHFTDEGRVKLENVSLSKQQEATLSLIDGSATINDICIGSSMMDYEVYRFLYLMVKAGVLG